MAKTAVIKHDNKPVNSGVLHPQPLNPTHELFYQLGVLRGANVEGAIRIAELVNQILAPTDSEPAAGDE